MKTETPAFIVALNETPMQGIFNTVITHLRKQGIRAKVDVKVGLGRTNPQCRYRGDNETMCAVGCLIPDNLYDTDMEDVAVDTLDLFDGAPDLTKKLLMSLQIAHDQCMPEVAGASLAGWESHMRELATTYKLEMPA